MASRKGNNDGVLVRVSNTFSQSQFADKGRQFASGAAVVAKKLWNSTGSATWYFGTTVLVLAVPLIIVMDREQMLIEAEAQNAALLGAPPVSAK